MAVLLSPSPLYRNWATSFSVYSSREFCTRNSMPFLGSILNFLQPILNNFTICSPFIPMEVTLDPFVMDPFVVTSLLFVLFRELWELCGELDALLSYPSNSLCRAAISACRRLFRSWISTRSPSSSVVRSAQYNYTQIRVKIHYISNRIPNLVGF